MRRQPIDRRLREISDKWTPPAALRPRVLAAASPLVRPGITWSDRVWFSTRWRLAAAVVIVAVIALDVWSAGPGGTARREAPVIAQETAQAVDEAARQAGLGPDKARAMARLALALASQRDPERDRDRSGTVLQGGGAR